MPDEPPSPAPRPPPLCTAFAVAIPIVSVLVPFLAGLTDDDNGDFRTMIAMAYAMFGGIFGLTVGIGLAGSGSIWRAVL